EREEKAEQEAGPDARRQGRPVDPADAPAHRPLLWPARLAGLVSPSVSPAVTRAAAGALVPVIPHDRCRTAPPSRRYRRRPNLAGGDALSTRFSLARQPLEVATWPRSSSF